MTTTEYIQVECPSCGESTPHHIPRYAGVFGYLHHSQSQRASCRILVVPDPEGDDHWAYEAPEDMSLEDARTEMASEPPSDAIESRVRLAQVKGAYLGLRRDAAARGGIAVEG